MADKNPPCFLLWQKDSVASIPAEDAVIKTANYRTKQKKQRGYCLVKLPDWLHSNE
jgi:hypothetical protein